MKIIVLLAFAGAASITLAAQSAVPGASTGATIKDPVATALRQMEPRAAKNLIGAADEMPADKYNYRPTPQQMTFAHLMVHVAEANNHLCSSLGGAQPNAPQLSENDGKEKLAAAVKQSFSYCQEVLAKADDSKLNTQTEAFLHLATGWADHYSMAAMYLRLNDLVPPSAQKADH